MPTKSTARTPKPRNDTKVNRPHKEFEHPAEVVADPALSKQEKRVALESLEQDARQLATASEEGMGGGETSNLRDVLVARETLELPPADAAFSVVVQTLEAKLAASEGTAAHQVIAKAIGSLEAARTAMNGMEEAGNVASSPKPVSERELEEELAKEMLDP